MPTEGEEVDPDFYPYPLCGEKNDFAVVVNQEITIECAETDEQHRYVIIQSTDAAAERLCLAEVRVFISVGQ